jgi:uncharacterized protein YutE (UPF0331/DUF86 family)
MTPLDRDIVLRKLSVIVENMKALDVVRDLKQERFSRDLYLRKAVERLLQELIEAAIDVNTHLIVASGNAAPDDYYDSFILAGRQGLIPEGLAGELAPSAGLRNRLVHEYDELDRSLVLASAKHALSLYPRYVEAVERRLNEDRTL